MSHDLKFTIHLTKSRFFFPCNIINYYIVFIALCFFFEVIIGIMPYTIVLYYRIY